MATISEFETNPNEYGSNYSKKSHLIIWDLKTGSSVHNSFEKSNISYTSFSKDSSRILICSDKGILIRIIDPDLALKSINNNKRGIVRELTTQEIQRYGFSKNDLKKLRNFRKISSPF